MREKCIDLIQRTGKFSTIKAIYPHIKGATVEEFVGNATDKQVDGITKACERELGIN